MSIFVEMTRTERKYIDDLLKNKKSYHQSEARLYELQLKNWERDRAQDKDSVDPSIHKEMKERYRKSLYYNKERVHNIDRLISKLHAH